MPAREVRKLNVFVSSSDNVRDERLACKNVCRKLSADPFLRDNGVEIDAYGWDDEHGRPTLLATETPNTGIFRQLGASSDFDVVVVIVHWVMGEGTFDEYRDARAGWDRTLDTAQPRPRILVYEKTGSVPPEVLRHPDRKLREERAAAFLDEV